MEARRAGVRSAQHRPLARQDPRHKERPRFLRGHGVLRREPERCTRLLRRAIELRGSPQLWRRHLRRETPGRYDHPFETAGSEFPFPDRIRARLDRWNGRAEDPRWTAAVRDRGQSAQHAPARGSAADHPAAIGDATRHRRTGRFDGRVPPPRRHPRGLPDPVDKNRIAADQHRQVHHALTGARRQAVDHGRAGCRNVP